jgi:zinc/manganese transport system substrate-binding protein
MKYICFLTWLIGLAVALYAGPKLNVVASVPDLGDMAKRIGQDKVEVVVLATGREDLHAVPARPSFLPKLNRADLVLSLGLDAEHAWLPALCAEARNTRIREDAAGWVETWPGISVLGVPAKLDRSEGEQHPEGNPHYNIGPQCGPVMAGNILQAFSVAAPQYANFFKDNAAVYTGELEKLLHELKEQGAPLRGVTIIDYHPDVPYLCDFYGMQAVGSIEPKAGVAPTAGHLHTLEETGKAKKVQLIVYNQSQNPKIPRQLAQRISCATVEIANAVGAKKEIRTWAELQRYNLTALLNALRTGQGDR